jgi:primosomal protein N' (replication factor Y)
MTDETPRFGIFAVAETPLFELTYAIPSYLSLVPGTLCTLPMQKRTVVGLFLDYCDQPKFSCREVIGTLRFTTPFSPTLLRLANWISSYYLAPISRAVRPFAPGFIWNPAKQTIREKRFAKLFSQREDGTFILSSKTTTSLRGESTLPPAQELQLRPEQQQALDVILKGEKQTILLHGITGSGKTEVYLAAAKATLESGKNVLVLVPEISLTPQMTIRFRQHFGDDLCVMHSMLTDVEQEREWFRAHLGLARIVLGVRSSVFSPLPNIGLVIVDEEHDSSYKCDETPCYHARDVSVKRASLENARCVLGSATPSAETMFNVAQGRYACTELKSRHGGLQPHVQLIDSKQYLNAGTGRKKVAKSIAKASLVRFEGNVIAPQTLELIAQTKERGEQSMVILNRRGFSNYAICLQCGQAFLCPNCSVSTTLHHHGSMERCHYCGFEIQTRKNCVVCGNDTIAAMGAGTQAIESEIAEAIPGLRVTRLDRDVLTSNSRLSEILKGFREREIDCLVGTQLLSKGHDFPTVTLTAIVHVEDGLFLPDFRATERTFQLISQAAGRAGRGSLQGTVAVQSLVLGHPVVELALTRNVTDFMERELRLRRVSWHPPYTRQILIEIEEKKQPAGEALGHEIRQRIVDYWSSQNLSPDAVRIIGPFPAVLERIRGVYRFQICLTFAKTILPASVVPADLLRDKQISRKIRIDVDPYSFL